MKDVLLAIGKDIPLTKLMHFYKHNLSLKDAWTNISASFKPIEGITTEDTIPDVTVWVPGTLVLSDRAIDVLPNIARHGELLPVDTPVGKYWILNCTKEVNADERYSQHTIESDQVLDVESLQFKQEEAAQAVLFKSPFDGYRSLFCTHPLMNSILNSRINGLRFSEDLVGGF
jgi:hypothetical protein